jgi:hypothetical protein
LTRPFTRTCLIINQALAFLNKKTSKAIDLGCFSVLIRQQQP